MEVASYTAASTPATFGGAMSLHPQRTEFFAPGVSRREFLRRSAGAAIALPGLAAILAACQERSGGSSSGATGGASASLANPDHPLALPTSDDNPPIADGLSLEPGPLRIFNWNDYIYKKVLKRFQDEFDVEIEYTQYTGMAEAISKIQNEAVEFDLFFPTIDHLRDLAVAKKIQPLNRSYLPNMTSNAWPRLLDPFYDHGGTYTAPYLTYTSGVGYRRDLGVLDEYRDTMAMALLHAGFDDVNTTDPAQIERAKNDLLDLIDTVAVNTALPDYQALGEGTHVLRYVWSGNMNYTRYYLPKGTEPDVLGYYVPPGSVVGNDVMVLSRDAKSPVLAHAFINFLFDRTNALDNFSYEGYQPPLTGVETSEWLKAGYIPDNLQSTLVTEQHFEDGRQLVELPADADQAWQDAWAQFKAGVKSD
jgi:spermidine/putrescine transport system substrate-binding protein